VRKWSIPRFSFAGLIVVTPLSLFDRWEDVIHDKNRMWAVAYIFASGLSGMVFGALVALFHNKWNRSD